MYYTLLHIEKIQQGTTEPNKIEFNDTHLNIASRPNLPEGAEPPPIVHRAWVMGQRHGYSERKIMTEAMSMVKFSLLGIYDVIRKKSVRKQQK